MNYLNDDRPGFLIRSAKITGKKLPGEPDFFVSISGTSLHKSDYNPGLKALVVSSVFASGAGFPALKYGVYYGETKSALKMLDLTFDKRAAAETAAHTLASIYSQAHVVILDYKKPASLITAEDDPEEYDRRYEDEGRFRIHHSEENPY